jgi:MFS superfamily sulfate permease-like transporter
MNALCFKAVNKMDMTVLLMCYIFFCFSETGFFGLPGQTLAIVVGTVSGAAICMGVVLGSFLYLRNRRHRISKTKSVSLNHEHNGSVDLGELQPSHNNAESCNSMSTV